MHESHALVLAGNDEPSAEMVRGVAAVLIPAGWVVSYHTERLSGPLSAGYLGSFDAVFAADIASDATRRALRKCKRIIGLRMDLTSAGLSSVLVDDEEVGRVAAEHLMGNGLRNLTGFALGRTAFADQRFASASRTVAVAGLNWLPTFVLSGGDFGRIDTWLDCLPKGTGVIAGCDEWGRVLIQRAREKGYLIPEQLQVIGVDNFSLACEVAAVPSEVYAMRISSSSDFVGADYGSGTNQTGTKITTGYFTGTIGAMPDVNLTTWVSNTGYTAGNYLLLRTGTSADEATITASGARWWTNSANAQLVITTAPVPEPAMIALLSLTGLVLARRRAS